MWQIEQRYMNLWHKYNQKQWLNYAEGGDFNLREIDNEIYRLLGEGSDSADFCGRKQQIWAQISQRKLVDKHPDAARLYNRLDLGNRAGYRHSEDDTDVQIARRMREDVIQLMRVRNRLSRQREFCSYVDLVFFSQELQRDKTIKMISDFVDSNLPTARKLISDYQISWQSWFSDLKTIGKTPKNYDPQMCAAELLEKLGLSRFLDRITVVASEDGFGFCSPFDIPTDVRVLISSKPSMMQMRTLFHELGHALGHAANTGEGLHKTFTRSHDEFMAVVGERIGIEIMASEKQREHLQQIALLEYVRCGLKSLFEQQVWEQPQQAEKLYEEYFSKLGLEIQHPQLWAMDTFMSLDPVYNHNYVMGQIVAERTLKHLQSQYGDDHQIWGSWLLENYYLSGRSESLQDKLHGVVNI